MAQTTSAARFWNRFAKSYAAARIRDLPGYERTLQRTRALLGKADRVLEVGCGTGTTALRLAPDVASIVATDVSPAMIDIAREKLAEGAAANVEFAVAASDRHLAPGGAYDAVLSFNLLHLVGDRPATLGHLRRMLKPGGLFISKTPCLAEMNRLIRLAVPAMRLFGLAPDVAFFTGDDLERDIAAAGFEIVETARHGSGAKDIRVFIVARKA